MCKYIFLFKYIFFLSAIDQGEDRGAVHEIHAVHAHIPALVRVHEVVADEEVVLELVVGLVHTIVRNESILEVRREVVVPVGRDQVDVIPKYRIHQLIGRI